MAVFEPITGFMFAYECIQIEPQDAVCGLYLLQAAIMSGSPKLILHAADITLSMRSRSGKIDYASIAIAAVREDKTDYAKTLLLENRLVSDTRSQRIRIGIPFHIDKDYQKVLDEINNTQEKHINDPTIILYEILTLKKLRKFAEALKCVSEKVKDRRVERRIDIGVVGLSGGGIPFVCLFILCFISFLFRFQLSFVIVISSSFSFSSRSTAKA